MSVSGGAARRDMWAGRIERCLASGMVIGERCLLRRVGSRACAGGSPSFATRRSVASRKISETSGWVKAT